MRRMRPRVGHRRQRPDTQASWTAASKRVPRLRARRAGHGCSRPLRATGRSPRFTRCCSPSGIQPATGISTRSQSTRAQSARSGGAAPNAATSGQQQRSSGRARRAVDAGAVRAAAASASDTPDSVTRSPRTPDSDLGPHRGEDTGRPQLTHGSPRGRDRRPLIRARGLRDRGPERLGLSPNKTPDERSTAGSGGERKPGREFSVGDIGGVSSPSTGSVSKRLEGRWRPRTRLSALAIQANARWLIPGTARRWPGAGELRPGSVGRGSVDELVLQIRALDVNVRQDPIDPAR